ncbi:MAG: Alkyl hydroperoxide reductase/ Thiol specific antioxidant/ Mal allergen [Clostridiales bacterium 38_11]|nr:MAG: Alkyl hydroperoxide reductase/ Thiol specific antioxidant/ Mal allergen [Clostridiales bacterium 38_11]
MNLSQKLQSYREESLSKKTEEDKAAMLETAENLRKLEIEKKALKEGDKIPEFQLKNAIGETIKIYDVLSKGPVIISFYRGAWCPYCNLEIAAYQEILPEIIKRGAQLVAISPEVPDITMTLKEKHALEFEILSDTDNVVAKQFGLVFQLEDKLIALYQKMGIDLVKSQENQNNELPIPATYVVNTVGVIKLAYLNSDYTKRLEPMDAVAALD